MHNGLITESFCTLFTVGFLILNFHYSSTDEFIVGI